MIPVFIQFTLAGLDPWTTQFNISTGTVGNVRDSVYASLQDANATGTATSSADVTLTYNGTVLADDTAILNTIFTTNDSSTPAAVTVTLPPPPPVAPVTMSEASASLMVAAAAAALLLIARRMVVVKYGY